MVGPKQLPKQLAVPLSQRAQQLMRLPSIAAEPPELPTPPPARTAAIEALDRGETHYTDRPGILPLRQCVAAELQHRYNLRSNPDTIVISCGTTEARFVALQVLLTPGQALLCLDHPELVRGPLLVRGATLLETEDDSPTAQLKTVKVLYLHDTAPQALREHWLTEASRNGWWVVYDVSAGRDLPHPGSSEALADRTVTIGTLGRSQGLASWRVGFLAAPREAISELRSFKQALTICTTNLSQWAALALSKDKP